MSVIHPWEVNDHPESDTYQPLTQSQRMTRNPQEPVQQSPTQSLPAHGQITIDPLIQQMTLEQCLQLADSIAERHSTTMTRNLTEGTCRLGFTLALFGRPYFDEIHIAITASAEQIRAIRLNLAHRMLTYLHEEGVLIQALKHGAKQATHNLEQAITEQIPALSA